MAHGYRADSMCHDLFYSLGSKLESMCYFNGRDFQVRFIGRFLDKVDVCLGYIFVDSVVLQLLY